MVIDDGSEPPVTAPCVVLRQQHLGAAAARNTGARAADGAWLLFCDDDLEISVETINALWSARELSRCVVPEVRGSRGELQNAYAMVWRRGDVKFEQHSSPMPEVAFPMGACFLVERDAYWEAGGCDERFFPTYYDDTMLGHALGRVRVRVRMIEALATHHSHGGGPVTSGINRAIYTNRWLYVALALSGPRRVLALTLGLPRTLVESVRKRTAAPFIGYLDGLTRALRG
jgi:GT2 family glycosyltransferase